MKKTEMLKKNYEFKKVLNKGKYYKGKQIVIIYLKENISKNLLGIAISKKVGNSVARNRIKRLIKENYRLIEKNIAVRQYFCDTLEPKNKKRRCKFLYYKRRYA